MAERIFRRKIYEQMLSWKQNQHGTTALLIRGARRVGKSTVAEEFARNEYESYILVDVMNTRATYWLTSQRQRQQYTVCLKMSPIWTTSSPNCNLTIEKA